MYRAWPVRPDQALRARVVFFAGVAFFVAVVLVSAAAFFVAVLFTAFVVVFLAVDLAATACLAAALRGPVRRRRR